MRLYWKSFKPAFNCCLETNGHAGKQVWQQWMQTGRYVLSSSPGSVGFLQQLPRTGPDRGQEVQQQPQDCKVGVGRTGSHWTDNRSAVPGCTFRSSASSPSFLRRPELPATINKLFFQLMGGTHALMKGARSSSARGERHVPAATVPSLGDSPTTSPGRADPLLEGEFHRLRTFFLKE